MNLKNEFNDAMIKLGIPSNEIADEWNYIMESYGTHGRKFTTLDRVVKKATLLSNEYNTHELYPHILVTIVYEGVVFDKNKSDEDLKKKSLSELSFRIGDSLNNFDFLTIRDLFLQTHEEEDVIFLIKKLDLFFKSYELTELTDVINNMVSEKNFTTSEKGFETIIDKISQDSHVLSDDEKLKLMTTLESVKELTTV